MLITLEEQLVEARRRSSELQEKLQNYYSVADVESPGMLTSGVKQVFSQPIPATKYEARTRQNLVLVCMCVLYTCTHLSLMCLCYTDSTDSNTRHAHGGR